jgi:hypothetical protein
MHDGSCIFSLVLFLTKNEHPDQRNKIRSPDSLSVQQGKFMQAKCKEVTVESAVTVHGRMGDSPRFTPPSPRIAKHPESLA